MKWASQELEGPPSLQPPFKSEHLEQAWKASLHLFCKGQAAGFPHGWLKISSSPGVHLEGTPENQVLGKVTHPSTILA